MSLVREKEPKKNTLKKMKTQIQENISLFFSKSDKSDKGLLGNNKDDIHDHFYLSKMKINFIDDDKIKLWCSSFNELLNDQLGIYLFKNFLHLEYSSENIDFWIACKNAKLSNNQTDIQIIKNIIVEFVDSNGSQPININHYNRQHIMENYAKFSTLSIFDKAIDEVYNLMKNDSYPRFLKAINSNDVHIIRKLVSKCSKKSSNFSILCQDNVPNNNSSFEYESDEEIADCFETKAFGAQKTLEKKKDSNLKISRDFDFGCDNASSKVRFRLLILNKFMSIECERTCRFKEATQNFLLRNLGIRYEDYFYEANFDAILNNESNKHQQQQQQQQQQQFGFSMQRISSSFDVALLNGKTVLAKSVNTMT